MIIGYAKPLKLSTPATTTPATKTKSSTRSRKNTADNFECRILGNNRVASCSVISRVRKTIVVVHSAHQDVIDTIVRCADNFPQVQSFDVSDSSLLGFNHKIVTVRF